MLRSARPPNLSPDYTFGYKPRGEADSAATLIDHRYGLLGSQEPDKDLGHSVRPGWRNTPRLHTREEWGCVERRSRRGRVRVG